MILNLLSFALAANALALPQSASKNPPPKPQTPGLQLPSWNDISSYVIKLMEQKPATIWSISPQQEKEAKRDVIRWGPYLLLPANATHNSLALDPGGNPFTGLLGGICRECMLLSGSTYLTYENGSVADIATGVYNHHVAVAASGTTTAVPFNCSFEQAKVTTTTGSNASTAIGGHGTKNQPLFDPSALVKQFPELAKLLQPKEGGSMQTGGLLFGSGDDGAPIDYASRDPSFKAGLYINKDVTVGHYTEIVNYRNVSQVVYITAEVEYIPGRPPNYHDASMSSISATGCADFGFFPPQNSKYSVMSPPYKAVQAGYIYNAHAHLHDGGVNARLFRNGTLVCDSKAIYGGDKGTGSLNGQKWETIQGYGFCTKPIEINVGDVITVEANYDLSSHPLRPGAVDHSMGAEAMGMLGFAFAPK